MAKILVVDDERSALWLAGYYLKGAGHVVTECASAEEAERIFRSNPGSIDLLVTDIVMPAMSGMDLARQLLEVDPNLPILFATGFTSEVWAPPKTQCVHAFVEKPLTEREFLQSVRVLLRDAGRLDGPPSRKDAARRAVA